MKIRLNAKVLASMPEPIRAVVTAWQQQNRKNTIGFRTCTSVFAREDSRYTAFSADLLRNKSVRVAGEYAGLTELRPTDRIVLPPGCTIVEIGRFCGVAYLDIFHNPADESVGLHPLPAAFSSPAGELK